VITFETTSFFACFATEEEIILFYGTRTRDRWKNILVFEMKENL
jgi:hypothetical protein